MLARWDRGAEALSGAQIILIWITEAKGADGTQRLDAVDNQRVRSHDLWLPGFLGAYVAVVGHNLATKRDTDFLNRQLAENTKITQSVQQQFSEEEFLRRRELEFRERQLGEFYGPVYGYLQSQKVL